MPQSIVYGILIPLIPLFAFVTISFVTRRSRVASALISVSAVATSFVLAYLVLASQIAGEKSAEFGIPWLVAGSLRLDIGILINPLTSVMLIVVTGISLLVQIYSFGYMKGDERFARFYSYLSLFTFSMLTLVVANNFILLYMAWELVGLCSYLLIGFWYMKPSAAMAAKKAFVVTRFGDFGFLIGIIILGGLAGSFNFGEATAFVEAGGIPAGMLTLVVILLFAGAVGKSGQFPLHVWLPDAMEGPTPVSALIHAATMVAAGVFLVARLFGIFSSSEHAMLVVACIGGFTALFAALIALVQNDIKRILAYSTISQLGYMMLALGLGGYGAGMFHLTTHAAFKALLFLGAGSVIHALTTNDIWQMGGLVKKMPVTTITFFVALLAISGIFPFSGFWSKDEILSTALSSGNSLLYTLALGTAFLTAFYMSRLFFVAFTGKARSDIAAHESPASMTVPLVILSILSAGLGAIGIPWFGWNIQSFLGLAGSAHEAAFDPDIAILSNGVALAGILLAFFVYKVKLVDHSTIRKRAGFVYTLLYNKFYIDEIYMVLIKSLFYTLARSIAWFDRHVVDGAVNLVGWFAKKSGDILRLTITGKIQTYALIAFCGVMAVVVIAILCDPQILSFLGGAR